LTLRRRGPIVTEAASGACSPSALGAQPGPRTRPPGHRAFRRREAEACSVREPTDKPPAKPADLMTRRVVARAKAARFVAVPVAILGDPEPGRSALEQREPASLSPPPSAQSPQSRRPPNGVRSARRNRAAALFFGTKFFQ